MTDAALHDPRAATLALLDRLIRQGRALLTGPGGSAAPYDSGSAEIRIWQNDCAAAINELSGGSKAHWLSRAYSGALLVRSRDGEAAVEADIDEIVFRILDVLEQARRSIAGLDRAATVAAEAPAPHRFDFVHDAQLRPVLEQAFADSGRAFEDGDYERAMMTACGIIEALLTDALQVRLKADATLRLARPELVEGRARSAQANDMRISDWSFDERIAAAEAAGLIRGGCARLPAVARAYRDGDSNVSVSERDAKVTRQVLRVVMRDLDPGR